MTLVPTPHGEARLTAEYVENPTAAAVILHGAGTDTGTPVLLRLARSLAADGVATWRLDQPYTLGPRRPPAPAAQLDTVAATVIGTLVTSRPLFLIGRSSGSRVACRIARTVGAAGVIALAFPLRPPSRGGEPRASRADELRAAGVPVTVLQGSRDSFGTPDDIRAADPRATVHEIAGADHGFDVRRRDGRSAVDVHDEIAALVLAVVQAKDASRR